MSKNTHLYGTFCRESSILHSLLKYERVQNNSKYVQKYSVPYSVLIHNRGIFLHALCFCFYSDHSLNLHSLYLDLLSSIENMTDAMTWIGVILLHSRRYWESQYYRDLEQYNAIILVFKYPHYVRWILQISMHGHDKAAQGRYIYTQDALLSLRVFK